MNPIASLFSHTGVEALGWALVHSLWQGLLIASALAGALLLIGPRRPELRYTACCVALASTLTALAGTVIWLGSGTPPAASPSSVAAGPAVVLSAPVAEIASLGVNVSATRIARLRSATEAALPWLTAGWLAGVLMLSARWLGGFRQAHRLTRVGVEAPPEDWRSRFEALCGRLRLERAVRLLATSRLEVPAVVGWLRPVVLVPVSCFTGLPAAELEALLAHELAHVRRNDYLANLLAALVEILFFFHPAVRWMAARTRQEREHCCDDLAVDACGDRLTYARALAGIELLRPERRTDIAAAFALAADGNAGNGALLARVRRLLQPAGARRFELGPAPQAAAVAALIAAGLALGLATLGPAAVATPAPAGSGAVSGKWQLEDGKDGEVDLHVEFSPRPGSRHSSSEDRPRSDFRGLPAAGFRGPASFELVREAGVLRFEGSFSGGKGSGQFRFEPSREYEGKLAKLGYPAPEPEHLFLLALHDVTSQELAELDSLGYSRLPYDELMSMAIHGVEPALIRGLQAAGYQHPAVDDLVSLRIHGVTLDFVRELAGLGYARPPLDELVSLRIHGVEPSFLHELKALGYPKPALDDVVSLRIHGATTEFLREMGKLGYGGVPLEDLISFRIHGVTPAYIRELEATGLGKLTADDLVSYRIHGVTADFVRRVQAKRSAPLDAEEILDRKIRGGD